MAKFFGRRMLVPRAAVDIKYILRAVREIVAALTELSERAQIAPRPKSTPDEIHSAGGELDVHVHSLTRAYCSFEYNLLHAILTKEY